MAGFAAQIYQDQGMGQLSVALSATSPGDFADRISIDGHRDGRPERSIGSLSTAAADQAAQESHLSALRADSAGQVGGGAGAGRRWLGPRCGRPGQGRRSTPSPPSRPSRPAALAVSKARTEQRAGSPGCGPSPRGSAPSSPSGPAWPGSPAAKSKARGTVGGGGFLSAAELGQPITSEFGIRFHPILHVWRMHTGLDFGGACGTPIYAAGPGTIISAGWGGGYGNRVVIDHGLVRGVDLATTYNHMVRIVAHGGHVKRGQLIGYEGTTGLVDRLPPALRDLENGNFVEPTQMALTRVRP